MVTVVPGSAAAQAREKLEREKKDGKYDRYAAAMKESVCSALAEFCTQDEEFARAVRDGGSFEDCMKAVAKNCGSALSDLEAYRRAVQFYFPGADIRFRMEINLCAAVEAENEIREDPAPEQEPETETGKVVHLSLDSFL